MENQPKRFVCADTKQSAEYVFTHYEPATGTGVNNKFYVFLVGLLMSQFTLLAYDVSPAAPSSLSYIGNVFDVSLENVPSCISLKLLSRSCAILHVRKIESTKGTGTSGRRLPPILPLQHNELSRLTPTFGYLYLNLCAQSNLNLSRL